MSKSITIVVPERESLPASLLSNIEAGFKDAFAKAEEWRVKALAIKVTDLSQTAEMKMARIARLELKNIRVSAEKTRKALKEDALRMGKAIDGVNNLLLAAIVPLEKHLEEQEQFAERLMGERRRKLLTERTDMISRFISEGQVLPPLDAMTEDQFADYLADTMTLHAAKIEAAAKAEAERIAREQAEAAERERVRLENEQMKKESAEREAAMKAERETAAKALAEAEAKAKAEREAAEKARAEAEAKAKAERDAIEAKARAEREAAAEKARKEYEAIEAKAKAEREARERLESEIAAKKAEEEAAQVKAEAEAAKAARAPDKAKVKGIAATVRAIPFPSVSTPEAEKVLADIQVKAESFAKWIETQAETL